MRASARHARRVAETTHPWKQNELEVKQNAALLALSRQILELAHEIRELQQQRSPAP